MSEFDEMMSREFGGDFGQSTRSVLRPDECDDHTAIHVLEGLLQVAACLDCLEYAAPMVNDKSYPLLAEFGIGAWTDAIYPPDPSGVKKGSPAFINYMSTVRSIASDLAMACESFLRDHDLKRIVIMVKLANHGWHPMMISSGLEFDDDDEYGVDFVEWDEYDDEDGREYGD